MKKLFLFLLLCCFVSHLSAQSNDKLSATTKLFMQKRAQQKEAGGKTPLRVKEEPNLEMPLFVRKPLLAEVQMVDEAEYVSAFIKVDDASIDALSALGVVVENRFNGFVTACIPVDKLEAVAAIEGVQEVSVSTVADVETDQAREATGVSDALNLTDHAQSLGLKQTYTGKGVIVGVVDCGIDFNHRAFKDKDGNTRIVKAYSVGGNSSNDLKAYEPSDFSSLTTDYQGSNHGTHTSSIAGGSTVEINGAVYGGMAPEADLVLCGVGSSSTTANLVNGVKYICDYADSVGKPCVINMSFGSQAGAHDGTGYLQEACNQLAGPGHILINSGGNDADHSDVGGMYLLGQASKDSPLQSVFNCHYYSNADGNYYYNCYASAWARTAEVPLAVKVMVISKKTNKVVWTSSEFTSEGSITSYTRGSGTTTTFGTYFAVSYGASFDISIGKSEYNNKYNVLIDLSKVQSNQYSWNSNYVSSSYAIAFSFYPVGDETTMIDCWSNSGGFFTGNTEVADYNFIDGSNLCCSNDRAGTDSLILVGAYVTRNEITDHNGKKWSIPSYELGNYAPFSSYTVEGFGPIGRKEPTISAPGATIVSAVNHYSSTYTDDSNASADCVRVNDDVRNPYGNMSGTSMAAPCAAGIVALWLQADPTLSVADVKRLMKETAIQDAFTMDEAGQPHFGNGKINALGGLQAILSRLHLSGDANQDGVVTFDDVAVLIYHILGKEVDTFSEENADVNGDGGITVADVTALVNTILSKPNKE